jgi:hypothetical protein
LTLQNAAILLLDTKQGTKSDVTTGNRLFYDRTNPIKDIPYSKKFKSVKEIIIPKYIIPKEFWPSLIY